MTPPPPALAVPRGAAGRGGVGPRVPGGRQHARWSRRWQGEPEDGVLWAQSGRERRGERAWIAQSAAARAGIQRGRRAAHDGRPRGVDGRRRAGRSARGDGRPAACTTCCSGSRNRVPLDVVLQPMPLVRRRPVLLDRARRHPGDRGRRVRPAAAAERSRHAAFLLADGLVLRRAGVHAERLCTTGSTISSTGRIWSRGWRCRRCSCISRLCFRSGPSRGRGRATAAMAARARSMCRRSRWASRACC